MVQREFTNDGKKGSPPGTDKYAPKAAASGSTNPPPPPPPPSHHASHHHYYSYGPPHSYDHLPPSDRAPPGPYTTAQYDARKAGMPPPYHRAASGSPPSHIPHHGREPPPPHSHYPPMHAPPGADHSHHAAGYPSYRDEHRAHHWPPPGHRPDSTYGPPPPRFYETSQPYGSAPLSAQYPPQPHVEHVHPPTLGPYRYSDHTLQREAVSRLTKSDSFNEVDGREGATSPSQIESSHREEVTTMGCTCKKTKCLKLYCQCFAVKIYCGGNCRCMVCKNTSQFEGERKEAIRSILTRNPSAFDTKFKKENEHKAVPDRLLAHKLGCKCRKSACMKKYCECYAGSVKCSASCRCVGCKNMPREGMGPPGSDATAVYSREIGNSSSEEEMEVSASVDVQKKREPWMMNAAQNLAFLKHASPMAERPRRINYTDSGEVGSMPSLASEESPAERKSDDTKTVSVIGASAIPEPTSSEKTAVNALLMAARAMAEMSGQPNPVLSTPPASQKMDLDPPGDDETFETPQKNLLGAFKSPKRKQSESEAANPQDTTTQSRVLYRRQESSQESSPSVNSDEESPKREHPGDDTPSNAQKVKRSRIGSLKKGPRNLGNEIQAVIHNSFSTPQTKGKAPTSELTPVSARCIDFKKMHVNEENKKSDGIDSTG